MGHGSVVDGEYWNGSEHVELGDHLSLVMEAEALLWSSSVQRDVGRLEWLLHHDFTGVTRDGESVSREESLSATRRGIPRAERDFTEWSLHAMPWPLVLVTYRLVEDEGTSRHVSVWDISTGLARLRFHQGTWQDHDGMPG